MKELSLLEWMSAWMGCTYLSDLHFIQDKERLRLAREIDKLPTDVAPLSAWNDVLEYLADAPPEKTSEAARNKLTELLALPKQGKEKTESQAIFYEFGREC